MAVFVGLLRAINVAGGRLLMSELVALCEAQGFKDVKTYIQSGNVVFRSALSEAKAQAKLEKALGAHMSKDVGALLRTAKELDAAIARNPFKKEPPNKVLVFFLPEALPKGALKDVKTPGGEQLETEGRELYIHYPGGQGRSKLKVPSWKEGTGRNLNTVTKLAAMARALEEA